MDVDNAFFRFKKAQQVHAAALEALRAMPPRTAPEIVQKLVRQEKRAWAKYGAAKRECVEAILEAIGL
jgi:hypothetical protein